MINKNKKWTNKIKVFLCLSFILFICEPIQSQKLKIVDCKTLLPVQDVIVFSNAGKHLGISNKDGYCLIGESDRIRMVGLNISDTVVDVNTYYDFSTVCVNKLTYQMEEFPVVDQKINLKNLLIEFEEKSHKNMIKKDTVLYYNFIHTITVPDSNWKETIGGGLMVKITPMSKKRVYARVFSCNINYEADKSFLVSSIYNSPISYLSSFKWINTNIMFNGHKKFKKGIENYVDSVKLKIEGDTNIFALSLKGADISRRLKSKENYFFEEEKLIKQKYYSTVEGPSHIGINQFYQETEFTYKLPNYINKLIYKSVRRYKETFFTTEFQIKLSSEKCEECIGKRIDYKSWLMNYQNWIKEK